jgi:hypothetical protein
MADFTATIEVIVEVQLTAKNEDAAWEKAESKIVPVLESKTDDWLPDGATVFSMTVNEIEEG